MTKPFSLFVVVVLAVPDDYCQSVYNVGSNQSYYIPGAGGVLPCPLTYASSHDVWKFAEMTRQRNIKMLQFHFLRVTQSNKAYFIDILLKTRDVVE